MKYVEESLESWSYEYMELLKLPVTHGKTMFEGEKKSEDDQFYILVSAVTIIDSKTVKAVWHIRNVFKGELFTRKE